MITHNGHKLNPNFPTKSFVPVGHLIARGHEILQPTLSNTFQDIISFSQFEKSFHLIRRTISKCNYNSIPILKLYYM